MDTLFDDGDRNNMPNGCVDVSGLPGAPGVPRIELQRGGTAASVSWSSPRDDGGCRLDGYIVEYRAETATRWTRANDDSVRDLDLVVRNLKADTVYEFRVAAKNKAGIGAFSPSAKPTKGAEESAGKSLRSPRHQLTVISNIFHFIRQY